MTNPYDRNPFRLPPFWNAGYALPSNVDDEGIERRAFVTAWAPRGSFDDPKVGTGGYAVPGYVLREGYGQGAFVTKWAPRGTYYGPRIPHWIDQRAARVTGATKLPGGATKLQITAMGDAEKARAGRAPVSDYGLRSARALIETVKMMPPDLRAREIKRILDAVDPKLFAHAEKMADVELKAGAPADAALERGLAAAMSQGMVSELIDLGRGKMPPRRSQLGAVCYSCMAALGETAPTRPGFCWVPPAGGKAGYWRRLAAGETACPTPAPEGSTGPVTRTSSGEKRFAPPASAFQDSFFKVGPFLIPYGRGSWTDHRRLEGERKQWVDENVQRAAKAGGISVAEMQRGAYPFVKVRSPKGDHLGMFYTVKNDGSTTISLRLVDPETGKEADWSVVQQVVAGGNQQTMSDLGGWTDDLWDGVKKAGKAYLKYGNVFGWTYLLFKKIWPALKEIAAEIVDAVKDAAKWVGNQACKLIDSSVGQVAIAGAGAAYGGPQGAQLASMGAQVAGQLCSGSQDQPPPPPPEEGKSSMLPLLLLGGAGVAAFVLTRKK